MLARATVAVRLPAQDLKRARAFYAEKLGLEPTEERPGGLRYQLAGGEFALFESAGQPSGEHTQIAFEVDDIDAVAADLRARGLVFESYQFPGLTTVDGIADRWELPEQGKRRTRILVPRQRGQPARHRSAAPLTYAPAIAARSTCAPPSPRPRSAVDRGTSRC